MSRELAYYAHYTQDARHAKDYLTFHDEALFWEKGQLFLPDIVVNPDGSLQHLPFKTPYINIHFVPYIVEENTKQFKLFQGAVEYYKFLTSWDTDSERKDIELVIGNTNATMANFAVRQLGFKRVDKERKGGLGIIANGGILRGRHTTVFGFRDNLLQYEDHVVSMLKRLIRLEKRTAQQIPDDVTRENAHSEH